MIIFYGTKQVGTKSFMVFSNEGGALIDIPVDSQTKSLFMHHFQRLSPSPGKTLVEREGEGASEDE